MLKRRTLRRALFKLRLHLEPLARRPLRQVVATAGLVTLTLTASWLTPPAKTSGPPATHVVTVSTDHPSEAPITAAYRSTATGNQPKYLRLPTIRAQGYIQAVGVDQHRQIAVPTNIHLAGWFTSTVTPGDPGLSIIDGHLDGSRQSGIFAALASLKPGDRFSIQLANGRTREFRVITVQSLPISQAASALFSQSPGISRQLNLITCGGVYNQTSGYDHRVVVGASLMN